MLTLEEISLYLPYGVKMYDGSNTKILTEYNNDQGLHWISIGSVIRLSQSNIFKPLLFPLSCLDQEITVNGEVFIGRDEFSDYEYDLYSLQNFPLSKVLEHESFINLVKRKFDVFNLIPQGKAINVIQIDQNIYR